MTAPADNPAATEITPPGVEASGEQMCEAIKLSCEPGVDFPAMVAAGLRASFAVVAAEPASVQRLFGPSQDPLVLERQEHWRQAMAAVLRTAARSKAPQGPPAPPIVEPFLVGGVGHFALRSVSAGEADRLDLFVPELLVLILAFYYHNPTEAIAAAQPYVQDSHERQEEPAG